MLGHTGAAAAPDIDGVLAASRDLSLPVYVQASPARVRKRGEMLVIQTEQAGEATARLIDTSHLVLIGAVDVTAPVHFQCRLTQRRRIELKLALEATINYAEDHVIILDLGSAAALRPRVEGLGKSFSVVERGPVIV